MYSTFAPVDLQPGEELDPREGHEVAGRPAEDAAGDDAPGDRAVANFWQNFGQNFARFRLHRRRSLQANTRFAAFFKIYQII